MARDRLEDEAEGMWRNIDDFHWLKAGPSPNWSYLPDGDRLDDENWEVMSKESSVNDILQRFGLQD